MVDYSDRLRKAEWRVRPIDLDSAQGITRKYHYAHGGSNTDVYVHGLFRTGAIMLSECQGIAWWLPPTKSAALATYPENWQGVLSLSRLVILPNVPKNACTFLIAGSMKLIDRKRWPCLVTYADTWQGHTGGIYRACNWQYEGLTQAEPIWIKDGRMISRKAGPKTRTADEMVKLGCVLVANSQKHKFTHRIC